MEPAAASRVAVVSPHPIVRAGLVDLLGRLTDITVVDVSAQDGHLAGLDLVLVDVLADTDLAWREAAELVRHNTSVLAIGHPGPTLHQLGSRHGVAAVVSIDAHPELLVEAIETAAQQTSDPSGRIRNPGGLTDRQYEILGLIATGVTNREIARELHISVNTVKTLIRETYARIEVTSRAQAVGWYLTH